MPSSFPADSPDPRGHPFGSGHQARYAAGEPGPPAEHWRCRPGFPRPFGLPPLASRVILSRRGVEPSSRSADQAAAWTPTGFPRSARVRRDREGCPLDPGAVVPDRPVRVPGRHLPLLSGQPCTPVLHPIAGGQRNEASSRVHLRSPVRSSPRLWPPDGTVTLGLLPGASHPAVASDACPGGDGP